MNEISKETIYEIMRASGWDNLDNPTKDMKNFATRFQGRVYTLFKNEAQDIINAVSRLSNAPYALDRKIDCAIDGIKKIFDALSGHIQAVPELNFQTVRGREAYHLYQSLKKAGAEEETAGYAVYAFLVGKEQEEDKETPKPIPDIKELGKTGISEIDSKKSLSFFRPAKTGGSWK